MDNTLENTDMQNKILDITDMYTYVKRKYIENYSDIEPHKLDRELYYRMIAIYCLTNKNYVEKEGSILYYYIDEKEYELIECKNDSGEYIEYFWGKMITDRFIIQLYCELYDKQIPGRQVSIEQIINS